MPGMSDSRPPDGETRPVPPRYWWLKRVLLTTGVLAVALVVLRLWWGWEAERRWQARIAEYRAAGEPVTIAEHQPPPIPDGENAAVLLEKAAKTLCSATPRPVEIIDFYPSRELALQWSDVLGRVIAAHTESLELARQARQRWRADWRLQLRSPLLNAPLPPLSQQRQLSRLLVAAACYQHAVTRDDAAAVETLRDLVGQTRALHQMRAFLIAHLVGITVQANAVYAVEELTPALRIGAGQLAPTDGQPARAEQVRALIAELLDEADARESWLWAFYGERLIAMDTARLLGSGQGGALGLPPRGLLGKLLAPALKLDALRAMDFYTRAAQAGLAPNYPAGRKLIRARRQPVSGLERNARPMSGLVMPSVERVLVLHLRAMMLRRMAATALAVRLYEAEHGRRPAALADLVPDYLPAVPDDLFAADGLTVGYRPDADRPVLYSVGPDGVDDRGAYRVTPDGGVDLEVEDLVLFLDGNRPRPRLEGSATRPVATQTVENDRQEIDAERESHQDQRPAENP